MEPLRAGCRECGCPGCHGYSVASGHRITCQWCLHPVVEHDVVEATEGQIQALGRYREGCFLPGLVPVSLTSPCDTLVKLVDNIETKFPINLHPTVAYQLLLLDHSSWNSTVSARLSIQATHVWSKLIQLPCLGDLTIGHCLDRVRLQHWDLIRSYLSQWCPLLEKELLQRSPLAVALKKCVGVSLPFPFFCSWSPIYHLPTPTLPCLSGACLSYPSRQPPVRIDDTTTEAPWLSDDTLELIISNLDVGTLLKVMTTCQHWSTFCQPTERCWKNLADQLDTDYHRDKRVVTEKATHCVTIPAKLRFERLLFGWLAHNRSGFPLQPGQAMSTMKQLWQKGSIPKSMVTSRNLDYFTLDRSLTNPFPPLRAFHPQSVISFA